MNTKKLKITYYFSLTVFSAIMLASTIKYFVQYDQMSAEFIELGYNTLIVIPLAIIKVPGLIAVWYRKHRILYEWANAGFFYVLILGFSAHTSISDGRWPISFICTVALTIAYFTEKHLSKKELSQRAQ
ncbi:DoxX family protein [Reichenbachiella sp.]|uniref:DoxX family protein n=1 Tax=Reichenbachiella sp. TaxID=2184521 RepID=UPI003299EDC3